MSEDDEHPPVAGHVGEDPPAMVGSPDRLTGRERRVVGSAALLPILLAAVVLTPVAVATGASAGDVVGAALVYGGLLGLAAAFVAVDRLQARQCPRCHLRHARGAQRCDCGYDLAEGPRYACTERHADFLEEGLCDCGRRLNRLETARGVASQVIVSLKIGGLLLGFLLVAGVVLHLMEGNL